MYFLYFIFLWYKDFLFYATISSGAHGFVCKKYKEGHEPTESPPTPIPEGHCKDDGNKKLTEFRGYCYKFASTRSEEGTNWEQASSKCEELGSGFKLASIHSERESAFIYSMLSQLNPEEQDTEMWISANDRGEQEGTWSNSDNTPFDYTHWAPDEPNGGGGYVSTFYADNNFIWFINFFNL